MQDASLLQDFITETTEHLEEMENNLLLLEKAPDDRQRIDNIFRSVHTIKGSAEYLGMRKIANLAHDCESLMDKIRNGELPIDRERIDVLIAAGDVIARLVEDLVEAGEERTSIVEALRQIARILENDGDARPVSDRTGQIDRPSPQRDEAYDEELYAIFVRNLREGLTRFHQTFSALASEDCPEQRLGECLALIDNLASSANYMGYDQLSTLCEKLAAELNALWKNRTDPTAQDAAHATSAIEQRIEQICNLFHIDGSDLGVGQPASKNVSVSRNALLSDFPDEEALQVEIDGVFEENSLGGGESCDDAAVKPPADVQPFAAEVAADEIDKEIYDAELFAIFLQQLEEDFKWFQNDLEMLLGAADPGETPGETVHRWKGKLASLQSNANYMGYEKLIRIYAEWEKQLQTTTGDLAARGGADWQQRLQKGACQAIKAVSTLFPDAAGLKQIRMDAQTVLPERETAFSDPVPSDQRQLLPDHGSLLGAALREKIAKMPVRSALSHEVVSDFLFTDTTRTDPAATACGSSADPTAAGQAAEPGPGQMPERQKTGEMEHETLVDASADGPVSTVAVPAESGGKAVNRQANQQSTVSSAAANPAKSDNPADISKGTRSRSIRVDADKIDALMNQVGELVVSRAWFSQLHHEMRTLKRKLGQQENIDKRLSKQISQMTYRLHEATSSLGRAANELQEGVMRIRMLPVSRLFNRYPRLLHDLLKEGEKNVELEIRGEETELDKMVIEKISDPMIHIIRNAIDHGVEDRVERQHAGKSETAKLIIEAYHESNHVVIEVTDDGRGIDPDDIKQKICEKKLLKPVELEELTDREILALIAMPGFSTAKQVTHTSGRGVGMDVVKRNIEKLNGTVEIDSIAGKETRIRIKIPLTLAIIPALLVRVASELFTIPLSTVEETIKANPDDIESIEGNEVICQRNQTIPLIRLNRLFNMATNTADDRSAFIVIVSNGLNQIGLVVDAMLGQEEVVIKPLEDYLQEGSGFSGATILGDGRISLILDVYDLLNVSVAKMEQQRRMKSTVPA